jgi:NAD(P)-dependent dehydrogenase (short-subunit alcohol dehydrogenase family)
MDELNGRAALVTGSSRGIGAAIVRELAAHGVAVAVHGRDKAAARQVAGAIVRRGWALRHVGGRLSGGAPRASSIQPPRHASAARQSCYARASWQARLECRSAA